jgi:hypothetical protein
MDIQQRTSLTHSNKNNAGPGISIASSIETEEGAGLVYPALNPRIKLQCHCVVPYEGAVFTTSPYNWFGGTRQFR